MLVMDVRAHLRASEGRSPASEVRGFTAEGARSIRSQWHRPRIVIVIIKQALKARFNVFGAAGQSPTAFVRESRFQRSGLIGGGRIPGALPQADDDGAPSALGAEVRHGESVPWRIGDSEG
jgi:hypothetical protein